MKKRVFVRKLPAIIAAAGLLVSLSACAAAPSPLASCDSSGNAALVTADGSFGKDPATTFPTPLVAKKAEVSILTEGDGEKVTRDGGVTATASIYDGATGAALTTQQGALVAVTLRSFVNGQLPFTSALACASEGSRVVTTGTASQLFGPDALGLDPDAAVVVVSDIQDAFPGQANGTDQVAQNGFPAVVFTPNGQPGFTFPDGDAPTKLAIAALKQGSGATVEDGDSVIANLTGIVWGGTATFSSSFTNQAPATITATALTADGNGVVSGLAKALVGQQVGSRVIVVVPPSDGYPAAQVPAGVTDGDTLVFVVDILAID